MEFGGPVMPRDRYDPRLLSPLFSPFLMTLLGAGATLALVRGGERDEATRPGSANAGRASVSDDGETVDVTVGVLEADNMTHVVLRDADRNELVVLTLYRE